MNATFVREVEPGRLAARTFERGVGETRSCGTGAIAAVLAVAARQTADGAWCHRVEFTSGEALTVRHCADLAAFELTGRMLRLGQR
ncbi:hypothetical protein [Anaeromyxobacter paludicola]|uniref:hypothetical protein n=1 Tax=Anaeromyxobacter paludicola TaxID=2918171 RepID=UPI0020BF4332|nr:hypothetical protein [Anaeromyxobacter paludicola]